MSMNVKMETTVVVLIIPIAPIHWYVYQNSSLWYVFQYTAIVLVATVLGVFCVIINHTFDEKFAS